MHPLWARGDRGADGNAQQRQNGNQEFPHLAGSGQDILSLFFTRSQYFTVGEKAPYPFLPAVIIDENRMANHDVTKSGDGDRNQTVPVNE